MTRISRAMPTPTSSPVPPKASPAVSGTSPPSSTCRPESTVSAIAPSSGSMLPIRSGCVMGSAYCTVRTAVSPSSLSRAGPTSATCSRSRRRSVRVPISAEGSGVALAVVDHDAGAGEAADPVLAQQVDALLGTGARHVPVVAHRRAERRGERRGGGHEQDPGADHPPRMGGGRAAETVEVRRHGGLLGAGRADPMTLRPAPSGALGRGLGASTQSVVTPTTSQKSSRSRCSPSQSAYAVKPHASHWSVARGRRVGRLAAPAGRRPGRGRGSRRPGPSPSRCR